MSMKQLWGRIYSAATRIATHTSHASPRVNPHHSRSSESQQCASPRRGSPRRSSKRHDLQRHDSQRRHSPLLHLLLTLLVMSFGPPAQAETQTPRTQNALPEAQRAQTPQTQNHSSPSHPSQTHPSQDRHTPEQTPGNNTEQQAIRAVIDLYFRGHASGQAEYFRQAFHADARLSFIRDGALTQWPAADYIARAGGQPAADEDQRRRHIDFIDLSGDAAIAKVTLDYPQVRFTDYLSLLKVDGRWQIISKTFHVLRR